MMVRPEVNVRQNPKQLTQSFDVCMVSLVGLYVNFVPIRSQTKHLPHWTKHKHVMRPWSYKTMKS